MAVLVWLRGRTVYKGTMFIFVPLHSNMGQAAEVYAEELSSLRFGHPLWFPEEQVQIGDVGFLDDGHFHPLFNITIAHDHPYNDGRLPADFETFSIPSHLRRGDSHYLEPGTYASQTVQRLEVGPQISFGVGGAGQVTISYKFKCSNHQGALLSLNSPAESQNINRSSKFRDFVARNHRAWYDYVTSELDIDCRPEELVCISGWIKTSEWTVAAFTKESNSHDCTIQGQIGSVGGIGCGLHITHSKGMTPIQRSGPKCLKGRNKSPAVSDGDVLAPENDQTIFVQFYQVKYRRFLWPKTMRAAAGPDALPDADGEEDDSTLVTVRREGTYGSDIYDACAPRDEFQTALNPLLDYLLKTSDTDMAIASHGDLYSLTERISSSTTYSEADEDQQASDNYDSLDDELSGLSGTTLHKFSPSGQPSITPHTVSIGLDVSSGLCYPSSSRPLNNSSPEAAFILPSEPPDRHLDYHWDIHPTRMPTIRLPDSQISYPCGIDTLPAVEAIPQLSYAPPQELARGPSHIEEGVSSDIDVDERMELTADEIDTPRHRPSSYPKKKALLIGIEYSTCRDRNMKLNGTVRDAEQLKQLLTSAYGYAENDVVLLTDTSEDPTKLPTRKNIIDHMECLVRNAEPGDRLFFSFSGHGRQIRDRHGTEEDGLDEVILPLDFEEAGYIADDVIREILLDNLPPDCQLNIIIDTCHSGAELDLPYTYSTEGMVRQDTLTARRRKDVSSSNSLGELSPSSMPGTPQPEAVPPKRTHRPNVICWDMHRNPQKEQGTSIHCHDWTIGSIASILTATLRHNIMQSYEQLLHCVNAKLASRPVYTLRLSSSHLLDLSSPISF